MSRAALLGGLLIVGAAAYVVYRSGQFQQVEATADDAAQVIGDTVDDVLTTVSDALEGIATTIDSASGGFLKISAMAKFTPDLLNVPNVRAMLRVIRRGEGTADEGGYSRLFGGGVFSGFADHPRQVVKKSGYTSSAAGAYQFIASSWDETKRVMNLPDFSPRSQDAAAVGRIIARGALDDVIAGRFEAAIKKIAREWASLPGSPYGQPTISMSVARNEFASAGGAERTITV